MRYFTVSAGALFAITAVDITCELCADRYPLTKTIEVPSAVEAMLILYFLAAWAVFVIYKDWGK